MKHIFLAVTLLCSTNAYGQPFTEISEKPLDELGLNVYWTGAAWVDIDQDDDLDLFLTNRQPETLPALNRLLINNNDHFELATNHFLASEPGFWFSVNIIDYNNDGLTDIYVAGIPGALYRNLGGGDFEKVATGDIATLSAAGIASAWGDFNLDGNLDMILMRPNWMPLPPIFGPPPPPQVYINSGAPDYVLNQVDTSYLPGDETFLQPTLFDVDDDGDLDVFTGMGSGAPKRDFILINKYVETGAIQFVRDENSMLSKEMLEGNHWSFPDIDNDGDFDAFVTNWAVKKGDHNHPKNNNLYENRNGIYEKKADNMLMSTYTMSSTASWGDFDNDGDLDFVEVNDSTYSLKYFRNDGTGVFTPMLAGDLGKTVKHQSGISIGDYDNDGDLDIFIPGRESQSSLFRNDVENENKWLKLRLEGTTSNRSAIGASLFLTTVAADGSTAVQSRHVSGSNTFFGSNALDQHFGLGTDRTVKELRIHWPSGLREIHHPTSFNRTITITEGTGSPSDR